MFATTTAHYVYQAEPLRGITTITAFTLRGIDTTTATEKSYYRGLLLHIGAKFSISMAKCV